MDLQLSDQKSVDSTNRTNESHDPHNPLALMLIGTGLLLVSSARLLASEPSILRLVPPVVDLGAVGEAPVRVDFQLQNNGSKEILVEQVVNASSCSKVDIPRVIEPFSSVLCSYTWNLAGANGGVQSDILIYYRVHGDDRREICKVPMQADVTPDYVFDCDFVSLNLETNETQTVTLVRVAQADVRLLDVKALHPAIDVRIAGDRTFEISGKTTAGGKPFDRMSDIVVRTNSENRPTDRLRVFFRFPSSETGKK